KVRDGAYAPDRSSEDTPEMERAGSLEIMVHGQGRSHNGPSHKGVVYGYRTNQDSEREYEHYRVRAQVILPLQCLGNQGIEDPDQHPGKQTHDDASGADL